jgi:hypothetical protein
VLVTVNGERRPAISLDCADPTCDVPAIPDYPWQTTANPTGTIAVPASVSAALVTTLAGCDPANVTTFEVEPAGPDVTLTGADVATPTDFLGSLPAIFYSNGSGAAWFRRPLRSPTDLNAEDALSIGPTLHVAITTSTPCMSVSAEVNHTTTTVGTKLRFTVTAQDPQQPGETLTATWDFRDGSHATASLRQEGGDFAVTTTHAYTARGTYAGVTVTVQGAGSSGSATIRRITVGRAVGAPGPGTKHPNRHHRSASGSPTTDTSQPTSGTQNSNAPPAQTAPATHHHRVQPAEPAGTPVSGVLVDATSNRASPPSAAQGVGGTESPGSSGPPLQAIGGGALALGLVALGALSERRGLRRRRKLSA